MKYTLGLDIGTTSIGWAVIDEDKKRIHDIGVRIFERAEDPQNGDSLAKPRRDARSARRRLKRRRQRLNHLKNFFVEHDILTKEQVDDILSPTSKYNALDVYTLRSKALQEALTPEELLKVLYQIAKRRGFKSNRKVQEEADAEGGRVTKALKANEQLLTSRGYKTAGEALARDEMYATHRRNKRDDYTNSFARTDFERELQEIIKVQRTYVLKNVSDSAINELLYGVSDGEVTNPSAVLYQRPFMTKELIESMIGNCTFEPNEKRAPRASYSFELFRLVSDLAHLEYIPRGTKKRDATVVRLTPEQIDCVITVAKKGGKLTYKKVRESAGISDEFMATYIRGKIAENDPYGEENDFGNLKAYHDIRLALKNLPGDWQIVDNEDMLNQVAYTLTTEKSDEGILTALAQIPVSQEAKRAIVRIKPTHFKSFGHLSVKALRNITPHIIAGLTYDKACEAAGYDFRKKGANLEQITNPVVKRAISQTLKVVKAVERKYGAPYYIRVETARELAKNFKDRKSIEQEQKENQARNTVLLEKIKEHGITNPTGMQIIKFKLYNEQHAKSLYSGTPISLEQLLHDDNAYQVDHIIPFSRSGNDSLANKALVTTAENQEKGNKTPYEWLGGSEVRWKELSALVESIYKTQPVEKGNKDAKDNYKFNGYAFKKKGNLLTQSYTRSGWAESPRALNDTRYITKFIQNYLRQTVDFARGDRDNEQRVFAPNGTLTAYMRKRWGLAKDRTEDVLHHAKDAAVIAVMDQKMIYRANQYSKSTEMRQYLTNAKTIEDKAKVLVDLTDKETGEILDGNAFSDAQTEKKRAEHIKNTMEVLGTKKFPEPWERFREEVDWRTRPISAKDLRDKMRNFDTYDTAFTEQTQPIFVSRMPNRKASGGAHKETLRSAKADEDDMRTVRTPLTSVKLKDLEHSPVKNTDPQLYQTLKERLETHGDKPDKAFAEPVYKKDKNGNDAHEVRAIKVASKQPSGFYVNKERAFVNNGSMVRLDVYQKQNAKGKIEHFFVPVYTHQIPLEKRSQKITKILPAPKGFTDVDDTFTKVTSLFPNDYVRVYFGNKITEGYYVKYGSASGQVVLISHLSAGKDDKQLLTCSARSAVSIERYDVSILADNAPRL